MNIYVAASWRNEQQPAVVQRLRAEGHSVYDFRNPPNGSGFCWREIDPNWQKWTAAQQIAAYDTERAKEGFSSDFVAMKLADACVMVQPSGRSAALELGWCAGAGKRTVVLMCDGQEPELMLRMADHLCLTLDEVVAAIGRYELTPEEKAECRAGRTIYAIKSVRERLACSLKEAKELVDARGWL